MNERRIYYILWLWDWLHLDVGHAEKIILLFVGLLEQFAAIIGFGKMYLLGKHYSDAVYLCCVLSLGQSNKYNLWPVTTIVLHKLTRINGCDLGSCRSRWSIQATSRSTHPHITTRKKTPAGSWCYCCCCSCRMSTIGAWRLTRTHLVVHAFVRGPAINIEKEL